MNFTPKQRMLLGALAVLAVIATVVSVALYQGGNPPAPGSSSATPGEIPPLEEESITLLFCGLDETELLTDVIILARYDVTNQRLTALHIPRDSFIGEGYITGKINSVYGHPRFHESGVEELKALLEEQLALTIDYTATVTLEGVRSIVDAFGGVEVDIPQRIEFLPGKVIEPGLQTLNGEQAEWFLRYRKGYPMGDLGRIDAQELFLKAALDMVREKGRMETLSILSENFHHGKTDLPLGKAVSLGNALFSADGLTADMYVFQGRGATYKTYSVFEIDKEAAAELLNAHFRPTGQRVGAEALGIPSVPVTAPPAAPTPTPSAGETPMPPEPPAEEEETPPAPGPDGLHP